MKAFKTVLTVLLGTALILTAVFLVGRYGWKLGGFRACQGAGITSVEVSDKAVHITGFYPGSFPKGFCGYYAKEQGGKLYVGFHFSAVFGFFETGVFDITVPVRGEISEVILKTDTNETSLWNAQTGFLSRTERYGVYVKPERSDVYSVSMSYVGSDGDVSCTDYTAVDSGEYLFMDNDIFFASGEADSPIPFTITVKNADGDLIVTGEFSFDADMEKLYLTVTADGGIIGNTNYEP